MSAARLADPYRDLTVIDSRAPRFNQAVIGVLALLAVATGWWWILAALAANLLAGLTFGRRFCVTCVAYFAFVQPLVGEGPLEDSRPPRVANVLGFVFLAGASVCYGFDADLAGAVLASIVAAVTGFCTGCEAYKLGCRLTGRPFVSCPIGDRSGLRTAAALDTPDLSPPRA